MVQTELEIFYSTLDPSNRNALVERDVEPLSDGRDPSDVVFGLYAKRFPENLARDDTIIHSCSWHYDIARQTLVLSYLVHGNQLAVTPPPDQTIPLTTLAAAKATSRDPLAPHATDLSWFAVYRHAMRHMPYLIGHNPTVARALGTDREKADALISVNPGVYAATTRPAAQRSVAQPRQPNSGAAPSVVLETFLATIDNDTSHFTVARRSHVLTDGDGDPTDYVRQSYERIFPDAAQRDNTLLHSTSWHYDARRNAVVLTYLIYGNELPVSALRDAVTMPLDTFTGSVSGDRLRPHHGDISDLATLGHGLAHLSYLTSSDPTVAKVVGTDARRLAALRSISPMPSGEIAERQPRGDVGTVAQPLVIG